MQGRGVRIGWDGVPHAVRTAVEQLLGGPVVEAVSQPGGFSPGCADRVVTAAGRRAFVKAVGPELNEGSPGLHRREARVTALLPPAVPAPRLLGIVDDGTWVAVVLEDVEGRHPATPWEEGELLAVLDALASVAAAPLPGPLRAVLPSAGQVLADDLDGFARLAADRARDPAALDDLAALDAWARDHLDELAARGRAAPSALAGGALQHSDVRADNLLVRPDGAVVVVDWPHATRGAAWFDVLSLLVNVRLHDAAGAHDVDALLRRGAPGADPGELTAVLAGMAGYFLDGARRPAPPGLPTLRAFQAAQGRVCVEWLRERGLSGR